jgi:hypothetical protein
MTPQWCDFFREKRILPGEQYKMINCEYKKLSEEDRAVFVNLAKADRERFDEEKRNFQGLLYRPKV